MLLANFLVSTYGKKWIEFMQLDNQTLISEPDTMAFSSTNFSPQHTFLPTHFSLDTLFSLTYFSPPTQFSPNVTFYLKQKHFFEKPKIHYFELRSPVGWVPYVYDLALNLKRKDQKLAF